jgi:hypothetical protein
VGVSLHLRSKAASSDPPASWCLGSTVFLCAQSNFADGRRIRGPTIEGSGEGTRPGDLRKLKPKATCYKSHQYQRSEAITSPYAHVGISFDRLCNDYLM